MDQLPPERRPSRPWDEDAARGPRPPRRPPPAGKVPSGRPKSPSAEPAKRPAPPRVRQAPPKSSRDDRRGRPLKIALAIFSVLVIGFTGYGWAAMQGLVSGLSFTDVIDAGAGGEKPADGARDILLVGMDSRTDAKGDPLSPEVLAELRAGVADGELNTDTLILVHIPNDGSKAMAISLPRDSYVDIPGGYGKHKINSAYLRAMNDERKNLQQQGVSDAKEVDRKANQAGAKTLIATVSKLTGVTIDNYASINLLGFSDITKAIGGVDVCLKNDVDDQYSGAKFTKGKHTISGVKALEFVRQRHGLPRGDLDRVVRQQVFMAGMAKKVLSAGTLTDPARLSDLTDAITKSVVLNDGWNILDFAQQMKGLTGGQLQFQTIPVVNIDYKTPDGASAIEVDPDQVHQFVEGTNGTPEKKKPATPSVDRKAITVDVRNASGKSGLAADVSQKLAGQGFTQGDTGNASSREATVIQVPAGQEAAGQAISETLGGTSEVIVDNSLNAGQARVVLGTGYAGGATPAAAQRSSPAPAKAAAPADKPITADGVTCVN